MFVGGSSDGSPRAYRGSGEAEALVLHVRDAVARDAPRRAVARLAHRELHERPRVLRHDRVHRPHERRALRALRARLYSDLRLIRPEQRGGMPRVTDALAVIAAY